MNTCDTCKWWDTEDVHTLCSSIAGDCKFPKSLTPEQMLRGVDIPEDWCDTQIGDDDRTMFLTGPKFGCIHHEAALPTEDSTAQ